VATTFVALIVLAVILAAAGGGFLGYSELQRSLNSINTQVDANRQNITALRDLVDSEFSVSSPQEQQRELVALQAEVATLEADLSRQEAQTQAERQAQEEQLAALEGDLATAVAHNQSSDDALSQALIALQTDQNELISQVDEMGGDVDRLQADLTRISVTVAGLDTAVNETFLTPDELQRTLALFRAWQIIARARIHLLDNNAGLARNDVESSLRTIDYLISTSADAAEEESLRVIQTRLALAFSNLADQPQQAINDLESAWSEMDNLLFTIVFPDTDVEAVVNEAQATPTIEPSANTTPPAAVPTATSSP
jgi:chromosome segregation ATPase